MALETINLLEEYITLCRDQSRPIVPYLKSSLETAIENGDTPTALRLSGNQPLPDGSCFRVDDEALRIVMLPVAKVSFLRSLDLSHNRLTDASATVLSLYLMVSVTI